MPCVVILTFLLILFLSMKMKKSSVILFKNGSPPVILSVLRGFFKDKKLTGEWTSFDTKGNKTQTAFYKAGKKVGKWLVWNKNILKEIDYYNNAVVSINTWKSESKVAVN